MQTNTNQQHTKFRVERIISGSITKPSVAELILETDDFKSAFDKAKNDKSGENVRITKNGLVIGVLIKNPREFFRHDMP